MRNAIALRFVGLPVAVALALGVVACGGAGGSGDDAGGENAVGDGALTGVAGYCNYVGYLGETTTVSTPDEAVPFLDSDLSEPPNDTNTGDFQVRAEELGLAAEVSPPPEIQTDWTVVVEAAQGPDAENYYGDPVVSGARVRDQLEALLDFRSTNCREGEVEGQATEEPAGGEEDGDAAPGSVPDYATEPPDYSEPGGTGPFPDDDVTIEGGSD